MKRLINALQTERAFDHCSLKVKGVIRPVLPTRAPKTNNMQDSIQASIAVRPVARIEHNQEQ
jgi:hypothetical protein